MRFCRFVPALVGATLAMAVAVDAIRKQEAQAQHAVRLQNAWEGMNQHDRDNLKLLDAYGGRASLNDVEHAVDIYEVQ